MKYSKLIFENTLNNNSSFIFDKIKDLYSDAFGFEPIVEDAYDDQKKIKKFRGPTKQDPILFYEDNSRGIGITLVTKQGHFTDTIHKNQQQNIEEVTVERIENLFQRYRSHTKNNTLVDAKNKLKVVARNYYKKITQFLKSKKLSYDIVQSSKTKIKYEPNAYTLAVEIQFLMEPGMKIEDARTREAENTIFSIRPTFVFSLLDVNKNSFFPGYISPRYHNYDYSLPPFYDTIEEFEENAFGDFLEMFTATQQGIEAERNDYY